MALTLTIGTARRIAIDSAEGSINSAAGALPDLRKDPFAYDTVKIAGTTLMGNTRLPMKIDIRGKKSRRTISHKSPGQIGSTVYYSGFEPAKVNITFRMWEPEHLAAYEALVPLILPRKTGGVARAGSNGLGQPLLIEHPSLAIYDISALHVLSFSLPEHVGKQVIQVVWECEEFNPNNAGGAVKKPDSSRTKIDTNNFKTKFPTQQTPSVTQTGPAK